MARESGDRKKEKKEKKRREAAEELEVKEKKISKKHKSESKKSEKPEKSKKKSKKIVVEEEEKPHKKSKEKRKKHKKSEESPKPEIEIDVSHVPVVATINNNDSDLDFEYDREDIKGLLESYSKEELVNLIYKTGEKGSRLFSAVIESAERDSSKRNIFVRGLGWDTTHENLKAAFEVYGEIEECSVVMDKDTGKAKGYGFVLFKTRKGAREALRNPEKRMYNRTVSCNLAAAKPSGVGKAKEPVESVKIDLTREVALPGLDLPHGHGNLLDNGQHQQNMPMYPGQNMPFFGHHQPPGFNPMYGPMMGNHMIGGGMPNYRMFGPGMMNPGGMMPPNHVGMAGQYTGEGNGVGAGFEGERGWFMR